MTYPGTRAGDARALLGAAALGSLVGLSIGGAYLAGGMARAGLAHTQVTRLAESAPDPSYGTFADARGAAGAATIAPHQDTQPAASAKEQRLARFAQALQSRPSAPSVDHRPEARLLARAGRLTSNPVPAEPFHEDRASLEGVQQNSRDLQCLTQAVYYEARGESESGQAAVAQVVLNRTRHDGFPKSVCGVVFQGARTGGCQFSFACNGAANRRTDSAAWGRAEQVASRALDGFVMPEVGGATHFRAARQAPTWGPGLLKVAQVGAHVFYRLSHGAGLRAFEREPEVAAAPEQAPSKSVYASLSLAPIASSVANSVAHTVAAGAELVMAAVPKAAPAKTASADQVATAAKPADEDPAKTAPAPTS